MSKVWEDEEIRNATESEQEEIEKKGGGIGQFELIEEVRITSPVTNAIVHQDTLEMYDDFLVTIDGVTAQDISNLYVAFRTNNTTSTAYITQNNVLTPNARNFKILVERLTNNLFKVMRTGSVISGNQFEVASMPEDTTFDNKISRIVVYNNNNITSGLFRLLGRKRF